MDAEILAVGTELLMGQIANTNAQYISKRLSELAVNVYYHSVVGDNPDRLKKSLATALGRSDIVIMTGGLGPTMDDLTKQTVSEFFRLDLVEDSETVTCIREYFSRLGRFMTENNMRQAQFPKGSTILRNRNGTAPGCIVENEGKAVVLLPGPPSEMQPMFDETVMPYLRQKSGSILKSIYLKVFGVGESRVETIISDLINNQKNPTIAPYAKDGEVTLRLTAKAEDNTQADILLEPVADEIKSRLGNAVYADSEINLEDILADLLIKGKTTLSVAESCTGGLLCAKLTSIPGISDVFKSGVVCYSNQSKIEQLAVNPSTLEKYGAVSRETAQELCESIRRLSQTDIGISITGIAGPAGGSDEKPVGLVYIGFASDKGTKVQQLNLTGNRTRIRNLTVMNALDIIRKHLLSIQD